MRFLSIIALLFFAACDNEDELPIFPADKNPTKGYDAFIFACTTDGEKEEICNCQADVLARDLTDEQIYILTEAGVAASNGDIETIDNVMENHPEVIIAMKNLSIDAEICVAAANTSLENFTE